MITQAEMATSITAGGTITIGGDLVVHRVGFGTLQLCGDRGWGPSADHDNAISLLRTAIDVGVNLLDTADAYGPHVAEDLIAEALYPYPSDLVIATKGGQVRGGPNRYTPLGRPEYLRQCVEMSLRRLKLERIDLYQLHRIDPTVAVEDQFGLLREMQLEGKIRHIGLSEVDIEQVQQLDRTVDFVSVQNLYNLAERQHDPVRRWCEERGLPFMPWWPLANGSLTPGGAVATVAARHGATPAQIALAWILRHSPSTVLIAGTSSHQHFAENVMAAAVELDDAELDALRAVGQTSAPPT